MAWDWMAISVEMPEAGKFSGGILTDRTIRLKASDDWCYYDGNAIYEVAVKDEPKG